MIYYIIVGIAVSLFSIFIMAIIRLAYDDGKKAADINLEKEDTVIEKQYLDDSVVPASTADELLNKLHDDATGNKQ